MILIASIVILSLRMSPVVTFCHNVTFLDLIVKLSKGRLTTNLHVKDRDRHHYLHFNSSHPDHTKRSIIYSQAKICNFENDFLRHRDEMKSWFQKRGCPEDIINTEMKR